MRIILFLFLILLNQVVPSLRQRAQTQACVCFFEIATLAFSLVLDKKKGYDMQYSCDLAQYTMCVLTTEDLKK